MRSLKNEGVKTIFGYPGGAIMPVFDALYDYTRGEKKAFNHILVRHEQAAAHAAEGFARVSGEVGVCLVTSGPGVTNTLTGVADAMMDSTPIVVIAGQVGVGALGTDAFQEVDLVGLSQPITKWSYQIRRPEDMGCEPCVLHRSLRPSRSCGARLPEERTDTQLQLESCSGNIDTQLQSVSENIADCRGAGCRTD